jgi:Lipase (class 3)
MLETALTKDQLEDIRQGLVLAFLSITDDEPDTLAKVGKTNPWQVEALRLITGSEKRAHRPLTQILKEDQGLEVDKIINISKVTPGGQLIDTQGYIAHNESTIVLAYRCTTSAFDWIVNFNTTSSVWEIEEDSEQGFSGYCSCLQGLCHRDSPRVHTGFYNNFLASLPIIKQYIEPLLAPDQPPRKLFVTGHSLGAGIATLAAVYFLLEFDWNKLPHTFVNVTAGSPRVCGGLMQQLVHDRISELDPKKARVYRVVAGRDVVASVPPSVLNFKHIVPPVEIRKPDGIIVLVSKKNAAGDDDDQDGDPQSNNREALRSLRRDLPTEVSRSAVTEENTDQSKYERMLSRIPEPLRDHMPEFYIKPVYRARGMDFPAGSIQLETVEEEPSK